MPINLSKYTKIIASKRNFSSSCKALKFEKKLLFCVRPKNDYLTYLDDLE